MKDAILNADEMGYTYMKDNEVTRYTMSVDNEEFKTFGIGIYYYLDYLKTIAFAFFIMALVMIPVMILNRNS